MANNFRIGIGSGHEQPSSSSSSSSSSHVALSPFRSTFLRYIFYPLVPRNKNPTHHSLLFLLQLHFYLPHSLITIFIFIQNRIISRRSYQGKARKERKKGNMSQA